MNRFRQSVIVILLVVFLLPLAGFGQTEEESMLDQARKHYSNGDYYFAAPWLERILDQFPKSKHRKEVLLLISKVYAVTWREEKAAQSVTALLKEYPEAANDLDPKLLSLAGIQAAPAVAPATPPPAAAPPENAPAAPQSAPEKISAAPSVTPAAPPAVPPVASPAEPSVALPAVSPVAPAAVPPVAPAAVPDAVPTATPLAVPPATPPAATPPAIPETTPPALAPAVGSDREEVREPVSGQKELRDVGVSEKSAPVATGATVAAAPETATYTVKVGQYVVLSALTKAKKRVTKAGFAPTVTPGPKKVEPMIRLYVGEFATRAQARTELEKLQKAKGEGFILGRSGAFHLYAGSFINEKFATLEQDRLAGQGIKVTLQKKTLAVPTFVLTVGSFRSREAAEAEAGKLRKAGVATTVVEVPSADSKAE